MLTREEAIELADAYIKHQNEENSFHPEYEYAVSEPREYEEYWFFNFEIRHVHDLPKKDWEMFAGAPGYLVYKNTGQVKTTSWEKYSLLDKREALLKHCEQVATQLLTKEWSLQILRKHFKLPLPALIAFKKELENPGLSIQQKEQILKAQLMQEAVDIYSL
ncbi:MAG TPA: hypothetical protein VF598_05090 [Hymenobacter sp.]|jgi:hypothetical protein